MCPYCHRSGMTPPAKLSGNNLYGLCPHCERKSRAKITRRKGGGVYIGYSATSKPKPDRAAVKRHYKPIRLSDNDIAALKSGAAVISLNRRGGLMIVYQTLIRTDVLHANR